MSDLTNERLAEVLRELARFADDTHDDARSALRELQRRREAERKPCAACTDADQCAAYQRGVVAGQRSRPAEAERGAQDFDAWREANYDPAWNEREYARAAWNAARRAAPPAPDADREEWTNEQRVLLIAALAVMEKWDDGLDEQDGPEFWNARRDWDDCLAALRKWRELDAARTEGKQPEESEG